MNRLNRWIILVITAITLGNSNAFAQAGHVLQGVGAENRSMQGASTGNPLNGCGALYWNVAGLSRVKQTTLAFGTEYFSNDLELSSSYGPMSGSDSSDFGPEFIPNFCFVYVPEDSKWTFGLELQGVAGFGTNFDASNSNPILMPQPNGFGAVSSEFTLADAVFGISYQATDKLALGFAPIVGLAGLEVDPFPGTAPGPQGYVGTDKEYALGYGFQFGILYDINSDWSVGASYKTEQDFESFDFETETKDFSFDMDFPSVASVGVGYNGFDRFTINLDLRYIDYESTDGFSEDAAFAPDGSVKGFGWESIWQIALGVAYEINEELTLYAGYSHNENPINSDNIFFNVHSAAIIQDHASIGLGWQVTKQSRISLGWTHGFKNSVSGPMHGPGGPIAGTEVESEMSTDSILLGYSYKF